MPKAPPNRRNTGRRNLYIKKKWLSRNTLDIVEWSAKWENSARYDDRYQHSAVSTLLKTTRITIHDKSMPFQAQRTNNILHIKIEECLHFEIDLKKRVGLLGMLTPKVAGCDKSIPTELYMELVALICVGVGAKSTFLIDEATINFGDDGVIETDIYNDRGTNVPLSAVTAVTRPRETQGISYYSKMGYVEPYDKEEAEKIKEQTRILKLKNPRNYVSREFVKFAESAGVPFSNYKEMISAAIKAKNTKKYISNERVNNELIKLLREMPRPIAIQTTFPELRISRSLKPTNEYESFFDTRIYLDADGRGAVKEVTDTTNGKKNKSEWKQREHFFTSRRNIH